MNKNAKVSSTGMLLTALVIGLLVIGGLAVYGLNKQQFFGPSGEAQIVTSASTMSFVASDILNQGTVVGGTQWVSIGTDDAFKASVTSANPGAIVNVLFINNSNYHNVYLTNHKVNGVSDAITVKAYGNASLTMTVFNTNSNALDDDAVAGLVNQTAASGGSYNLKIRMDGQDKKSTNDMVCILESNDATKMDKMTLNGFGATYRGMSKPSTYTALAAASQVWVYDVPAITGAVSPEGTIGIVSKTGQDLTGTKFKITCRTKEYFIDSISGKVIYDIENAAGTQQSMASYSFTDMFN